MTRYFIRYVATDLCGTDNECVGEVVLDRSAFIACPDDIIIEAPPHGFTNVSWPTPEFVTCCSNCKPKQIEGFLYMGQLGNSYYYCSYARVNWAKADRSAKENGGHLVVINSQEENEFISRRLIEREAYIGLSDAETEGVFSWVEGASTFEKWKPGQPDNEGDEDFVEMNAQGYWYDVDGKTKREFVMEIEGCQHTYQIGGPKPGSKFRIGTTAITYLAEDGCGNRDECTFNVIVTPYMPSEQIISMSRTPLRETVLYPNPASEWVNIQAPFDGRMSSVALFDLTGKMIQKIDRIGASELRFSIEGFDPGMYLARIELENDEVVLKKLLVQK